MPESSPRHNPFRDVKRFLGTHIPHPQHPPAPPAPAHDNLPESAFYMTGTIEDAKAKAEQLAKEMGN
ncbi:hypothetical protein MD484_g6687, partial [Candolleomyces efflorescens]